MVQSARTHGALELITGENDLGGKKNLLMLLHYPSCPF